MRRQNLSTFQLAGITNTKMETNKFLLKLKLITNLTEDKYKQRIFKEVEKEFLHRDKELQEWAGKNPRLFLFQTVAQFSIKRNNAIDKKQSQMEAFWGFAMDTLEKEAHNNSKFWSFMQDEQESTVPPRVKTQNSKTGHELPEKRHPRPVVRKNKSPEESTSSSSSTSESENESGSRHASESKTGYEPIDRKSGPNNKKQPLKTDKQKDVKGKIKNKHTPSQKRLLASSESEMEIEIIEPNELGTRHKSLPKGKETTRKGQNDRKKQEAGRRDHIQKYNHTADCGWCHQSAKEKKNKDYSRRGHKDERDPSPCERRVNLGHRSNQLKVTREYLTYGKGEGREAPVHHCLGWEVRENYEDPSAVEQSEHYIEARSHEVATLPRGDLRRKLQKNHQRFPLPVPAAGRDEGYDVYYTN